MPEANVYIKNVEQLSDKEFKITFNSDVPAHFAWFALADDPEALFSDNAMLLENGDTSITLVTTKDFTTADLQKLITVMHLRQTY